MKTFLFIMANDTKWMEREDDLPFVPYPGFDFIGLAGDQPLRISGMSYDIPGQFFKIRLAWLSPDPMDSGPMIQNGWKIKE